MSTPDPGLRERVAEELGLCPFVEDVQTGECMCGLPSIGHEAGVAAIMRRHFPTIAALLDTPEPDTRAEDEWTTNLPTERSSGAGYDGQDASAPAVAEGTDARLTDSVSVAIRAQNPDLETAWRTIAWWERTCDYWREQAGATWLAQRAPQAEDVR
jgi:hypothetical protein